MATTTNYGWTTPDNTALVKDGASAIRSLGTAVDSQMFTNAGAAINKTIVDAKGDIIAATAADTVARLAVGTNDQVLIADSSTATGLKWGTPSGGGLTLISETTASALSSLSFSSIPQTYKQLLLIWSGIEHSAASTAFGLRFNNNSGSVYVENYLTSLQSGISASAGTGTHVGENGSMPVFGEQTNVAGSKAQNAKGTILIDNYASTTKLKTFTADFAYRHTGVGQFWTYRGVGYFDSTTAITSLDIFRVFGSATFSNIANTTIRLYGVS